MRPRPWWMLAAVLALVMTVALAATGDPPDPPPTEPTDLESSAPETTSRESVPLRPDPPPTFHTFAGDCTVAGDSISYELDVDGGRSVVTERLIVGADDLETAGAPVEARDPDDVQLGSAAPLAGRVDMGEIWPGIRVVLVDRSGNVEKLFIVAPAADPRDIRVAVDGATELAITRRGRLRASTPTASITFTRPVAYQDGPSGREGVPVRYVVDGLTYAFELGEYDRARPLVIDPLIASTRIGGNGLDGRYSGNAVARDASGNVYVVGSTSSTDIPYTAGGPYGGGSADVFIVKLDPEMETLLAARYLGGPGAEEGSAILIDASGAVYVAGSTTSSTFPVTTGAYDESYGGSTPGPYEAPGDVFVARLSADLSSIAACTYYGGTGHEYARDIAVDAGGSIYVTGSTASSGIATAGAFDTIRSTGGAWGGEDGYVCAFSADLSTLECATYLGGNEFDAAESIALADDGTVYVTGWEASQNFPYSPTAYDTLYNGGAYDAFVTAFSSDLTTLAASTFLGGTSWDFGYGITLDAAGNVYVTGHMAENGAATTFPTTAGAFQEEYGSSSGPGTGDDAFVSKLDPSLSTLLASTLLGGQGWECGFDMEWHADGHVYLAGCTSSESFPVSAHAFQGVYTGAGNNVAFVSKLSDNLTTLPASTFLGGEGNDQVEGLEVLADGSVCVAGYTESTTFPTAPSCYESDPLGGTSDAFAALLSAGLDEVAVNCVPASGVAPVTVQFDAVHPTTPPPSTWSWDFDNDGIIDATGDDPAWVFAEPGTTDLRIVLPYATGDAEWLQPAAVEIFDASAALWFDGGTTNAACDAVPALDLTSALTIEAWIRPYGWGTYPFLSWGFGGVVHKEKFALHLINQHFQANNNTVCLRMVHDDATVSMSCAPIGAIALDEWQHVAASYDAGTETVRIWIDGIEQVVTSAVAPSGAIASSDTIDLLIGNSLDDRWSFEGDVDEVRVWNVARSGSGVANYMYTTLAGDEPGLVANWSMDEGTGGVLYDRTVAGHDASIDGAPWVQGVVHYPTSVPEQEPYAEATGATLLPARPNPFRPTTTVSFALPEPARATLDVYDAGGRHVKTLHSGRLPAGEHEVIWDGLDDAGHGVASGVYMCRLETPSGIAVQKLVALK